MTKLMAVAAGLFASGALAAGVAIAAPPITPEGRAAALQKLVDCRKITDNAQRLACFDAAAAALDQAEAKGDIVVVDREQARKVRRQAFGFHLPSITLFERGEAKEEVESLAGKVASAHTNALGKWVVKLDDGAVWQQIDDNEILTPRPGMPVRINRASLGSFMMIIGNQRAIRVHRIE